MAEGYIDESSSTSRTFRDGTLHTGDLGFLAGGELYVAGRMRDLIIIRGCNYHPQDIERRISELPGVRPGGAAAFARPAAGGGDELALMLEACQGTDEHTLRVAVRREVAAVFGLGVADIVISPGRALPRTTSGKLRRSKARARYLEGLRRAERAGER